MLVVGPPARPSGRVHPSEGERVEQSVSIPSARPAVPHRRQELRDFLRTRRARISPAEAGLPDGGARRRTPGLRREEVAVLAGVGASWYQWLEQGRDITVSP